MSNIRGNVFPVVTEEIPMKDIQKYFKSQEMAELIEEYGDPIILNDSGQVTGVNQQCFAAMFEKIYKPIFETTEDCFYLYWMRATSLTLRMSTPDSSSNSLSLPRNSSTLALSSSSGFATGAAFCCSTTLVFSVSISLFSLFSG